MTVDAPELQVMLIGCSKDPVKIAYSAFLLEQEGMDPLDVWNQVESERVSKEEMLLRLKAKGLLNNAFPYQHIRFVFAICNISQIANEILEFPRRFDFKRLATKLTQPIQSRDHQFVTPPAIKKDKDLNAKWIALQNQVNDFLKLCDAKGVSPEESNVAYPLAKLTTKQISLTFQDIQLFLDEMMCDKIFWEIREIAWSMYRLIKKEFPTLESRIGIKCWENRNLCCNENKEIYDKCQWRKKRPHMSDLNSLFYHPKERKIAEI